MIIRTANTKDSTTLAEIHIQAFRDFFLTELGLSFLKTYYRSVVCNEVSIALCAVENDGEIVGFATGALCSRGYNRRVILGNKWPFFYQTLVLIFTRFNGLIRIVKNFRKANNSLDNGEYAELLSIAVLPKAKGSGVGKLLLEGFVAEVRKNGGKKVTLTTDYYNNDSVIEFYIRNGFQVFYDFVAYPQRRMFKMIKYLN